jgi:cell division transport system permease protein
VVEGVLIGMLSAVATTFLLGYIYKHADWGGVSLLGFTALPFEDYAVPFLMAFLVVGIVFGGIGGVISIGRYLKNEGSDLYE